MPCIMCPWVSILRTYSHRHMLGQGCFVVSLASRAEMDGAMKILFLCTGNSARSIIAEYLLRRIGQGRFEVYSAGSNPIGKVNPFAIEVLKGLYHIDAADARSKSWQEYEGLEFDFVITV